MKVRFSTLASFKLEKLIEYLNDEWGETSKASFILKLDNALTIICQQPKLHPSSKFDKKLRKCVLTKQTSILYEVRDDYIDVLNIIDNRQDPKEIFLEIKKLFG